MLTFALGQRPVYAQALKSAPTPVEAQQAVQERLEATRVPGERGAFLNNKDGLFLEPPTHNTFSVPVEAADFPAIQQLLQEKTCTYQIRQGCNLLCSAAISTNPTRRAQTGLQPLAPTSRVLCRTYALPDTDYVCSL